MRLDDRSVRRVAMFSLGLFGAFLAAPVAAINVFVRAAPYTETMPDGTSVTMWGYSVSHNRNVVTNPASRPVSPGAAIRVPDNDTLTITLINNLPVPTSFVLHGHNTAMTPVFTTSAGAPCPDPKTINTASLNMAQLEEFRKCRVRSFTKEAPPRPISSNGNASLDVVYTYANVKPGTYLYQSGTMPQIQVQMGLYGVVRKDAPPTATPGRSAYPGIIYDNDITILLSEVDPAVHNAVAAGTFSSSTLAYDPKYFLLYRYDATSGSCTTQALANCITPPTPVTEQSQPTNNARAAFKIDTGLRQLVRAVNAGIQSRVLQLIDGHWYLIAEDGNKFPYPREQYSALLPAAKSADIWFTSTVNDASNAVIDRQLTIFDRRMALTNNNADPSGGQMIRLEVGKSTGKPPVVNVSACPLTGTQGVAYACTVNSDAPNSTFALDSAPAGMAINATTGAITWTPNNAQAWKPLLQQTASNPVQVRVTNPKGSYATGTFSVVVTNTNDAPVAGNDAQSVRGGAATFGIASLLANDSDPDGDSLVAFTVLSQPAKGTLATNMNGTLTYTAAALPASGSELVTFTYSVRDNFASPLTSNTATVTLTVFANSAPVAVDDVISRAATTAGYTFIDVLANDYDVDGNLYPAVLAIVGAPNHNGSAVVVTAGCPTARPCIRYAPLSGFQGTESISYQVSDALGATSQPAIVRVNVE